MFRLLIILLCFLVATSAYAAEVCFEWSYTDEEQALISGYRIVENNVIVLDSIEPSLRTACLETDDTSNRRVFKIVAYSDDPVEQSDFSNPVYYPTPTARIRAGNLKRKAGGGKWIK